jgi:4'-phosphopantetheinyl transferase EntD
VFKVGLCLTRLDLKSLTSIRNSFLHPKEQAYFSSLQHLKRQESYLRGRYCAKQAISSCEPQKDFSQILIEHGVFQQPIVCYPMSQNLQVSISHTDTLGAALAFPEAYPMAIDIETIDAEKNEVIQTQLTDKEQRLFAAFSDELPLQMLWTIKEALSKAIKCGLMMPFDLLEVESFRQQGSLVRSHFKNFHQYQAFSFLLGKSACSLVCSQNTQLMLDVASIQNTFSKT